MSKPLIILGAGASYDMSPECENCRVTPLTKNLVDPEFIDENMVSWFSGAGNLLSEVIPQVRNGNKSFEEILTEIRDENYNSSIVCKKQFVALEFYLQNLFKELSNPSYSRFKDKRSIRKQIQEINNHKIILNCIEYYSDGKACFVSFNYDTFLEKSLDKKNMPKNMQGYTNKDIKIIKPHGSHDWIYLEKKDEYDEEMGIVSAYDKCIQYPDLLGNVQVNPQYGIYHTKELEDNPHESELYQLPALAIPLVGKDRYVIPEKHITVLEKELNSVDRILIIGWRAKDPLLLETMKKNLPEGGYKVVVVSKDLTEAEEISKEISTGLSIPESFIKSHGGGYSKFVSNRENLKEFFQ